jgi:hypothetical protein
MTWHVANTTHLASTLPAPMGPPIRPARPLAVGTQLEGKMQRTRSTTPTTSPHKRDAQRLMSPSDELSLLRPTSGLTGPGQTDRRPIEVAERAPLDFFLA